VCFGAVGVRKKQGMGAAAAIAMISEAKTDPRLIIRGVP
jgi:hypothetical protein